MERADIRAVPPPELPADPGHLDIDADERFMRVYNACRPYTMTSVERMYALFKTVEYIARYRVRGDLVECGVWRGGSVMLMAHALLELEHPVRRLYLYDTFSGMPAPSPHDIDVLGRPARQLLETAPLSADVWAYAPIEQVHANLVSTGYPEELLKLVPGTVENTIPGTVPSQIALLRLDTDWYASTKHELVHLFPRLSVGGVLIIDDYGHWQGAREATDSYLAECGEPILLSRIDYTGRLAVRLGK